MQRILHPSNSAKHLPTAKCLIYLYFPTFQNAQRKLNKFRNFLFHLPPGHPVRGQAGGFTKPCSFVPRHTKIYEKKIAIFSRCFIRETAHASSQHVLSISFLVSVLRTISVKLAELRLTPISTRTNTFTEHYGCSPPKCAFFYEQIW